MSPAEIKALSALRAHVGALLIQVDAMLVAATGGAPQAVAGCPRCGGELAPAGDVEVCAKCGANVQDGAVIAG